MKRAFLIQIKIILALIVFLGNTSVTATASETSKNYLQYPWFADGKLDSEWYISFTETTEAWRSLVDLGIQPGEGAVVAVIDTGVNTKINQISSNLFTNEAEAQGLPGVDDDENGYIDDIHGVDLVNPGRSMADKDGHGTQMAGIIAMTAGDGGGIGVAYSAKVMPVKVGNSEDFKIADVIEGIHYAVSQGADIINLSCGAYVENSGLKEAIEEASQQCIIVASAGNESKPVEENILYPAGYPEVIGVMSCNETGELSDFTNWNSGSSKTNVYDLAAPGEDIFSINHKGAYEIKSGTSQAAAVVSGALAVMRSMYPDRDKYTAPELKKMFLSAMCHQTVSDSLHKETLSSILNVMDLVRMKDREDSMSSMIEENQKNESEDTTDTISSEPIWQEEEKTISVVGNVSDADDEIKEEELKNHNFFY